jgi:hypothetical protein
MSFKTEAFLSLESNKNLFLLGIEFRPLLFIDLWLKTKLPKIIIYDFKDSWDSIK